MYVWKLKLGISKGYKLEYDSRPIGDSTDRHLAENPHPLPGPQTAATSTCKLGNTVIGIAKGHTAAQVDVGEPAFRHAPLPEPGSAHRPPAPPWQRPAGLQHTRGQSRSRGKKLNCSETVCLLKCQGLLCG